MIELHDVRKVFPARRRAGEVVAVDGVSLRVEPGEFAGVVGPSGSGKSTLVRLVNLLERPTSGSVTVDGRVLTELPDDRVRAARRSIGMVFQHFELLDSRTAAGNVEHPLELAGVGRAERRRRATELLDLVGLGERAEARPAQLSGGQKQRVAIARALVMKPKIMLFDEPTSALDPELVGEVLSVIAEIAEEGETAMLLITHEMAFARDVADRVVFFDEGRIVEEGAPERIFDAPESERLQTFLQRFRGQPQEA